MYQGCIVKLPYLNAWELADSRLSRLDNRLDDRIAALERRLGARIDALEKRPWEDQLAKDRESIRRVVDESESEVVKWMLTLWFASLMLLIVLLSTWSASH